MDSAPFKGFSDETAEAKRTECIVRLKIRENDVKSQIWTLMSNNDMDSVTKAEDEISKIFSDLNDMVTNVFDVIQGKKQTVSLSELDSKT